MKLQTSRQNGADLSISASREQEQAQKGKKKERKKRVIERLATRKRPPNSIQQHHEQSSAESRSYMDTDRRSTGDIGPDAVVKGRSSRGSTSGSAT